MPPVTSVRFLVPTRCWLLPIAKQLSYLPALAGKPVIESILLLIVDAFNHLIESSHFRMVDDMVEATEMLYLMVRSNLEGSHWDEEDDEDTPRDLGAEVVTLTSEEMDLVVEMVQRFYEEMMLTLDLGGLRPDTRLHYLGAPAYDLFLRFEGHQPMLPAPPHQQTLIRQARYHYDPDLVPERNWL